MSVLITRPLQQAQKTALHLKSLGILSSIDPMLTIDYLSITINPNQRYQAILLTSTHAVPALQLFHKEQMIFTVGDSTAEAVKKLLLPHHVISAHGSGQELALLVEKDINPQNGPLLYISGVTIQFDLVGYFKARGYAIDRLIAYEARAATDLSPTSHQLLKEGQLQFILFYSRRTAQNFAKIIKRHVRECYLESIKAFVLSEEVAKPLLDLPFKKIIVAKAPTEAALIEKLQDELFGKKRKRT